MSEMTIKGNGHLRELLYYWQLSEDDRKLADVEYDNNRENSQFFKYKNEWYRLDDFTILQNNDNFDGYLGFTAFSGLYVKMVADVYHDVFIKVYYYYQ